MTHQFFSGSVVLATLALFGACTSPEREVGGAGGTDAGGSGGTDAGGDSGSSGKSTTAGKGGAAGTSSSAGTSGKGPDGTSGSGGGGDTGGSDTGGTDSGGTDSGGTGGGGTGPVDPCVGVVCDTPPASSCTGAMEYQTYDNLGSCSEGECTYAEHVIACTCKDDACTTDPCVTVTCATPPATKCKDGNTKTTYAATGTCNSGTCSYAATDADCPSNQACSGQGACAVCKTEASCGASCAACGGSTPKCKSTSSSSACVGCLSNADCSGAAPVCNTSNNTCQARPSCNGLAKTCGPNGNQDCCASGVVTGGTFNRGNEPAYPATVSTFRLDNYEVTLGRYRKFVAAYSQNMIASGAGKNPNNASDPGWSTAWNTNLPAAASGLHSACMSPDNPVWTASPGTAAKESVPINCIDWYQAAAFCIWDGGRLPTEAEWNYAAAGGTAQRNYPWGGNAPDCSYANFWVGPGACTSSPSNSFNRVGSESPKGDGVWGQSDLAGNIQEWVQDLYQDPYPGNCTNCANLTNGTERVVRGGWSQADAAGLLTSTRGHYGPQNFPFDYFGIRCARNP
jgi:formylglycine-generating enzyme required for sulfatase activity